MHEPPRHARTFAVTGEVLEERLKQKDDGRPEDHPVDAWAWLLARRVTDLQCPEGLGGQPEPPRRLLIEVAAIAVAAVESLDRAASAASDTGNA